MQVQYKINFRTVVINYAKKEKKKVIETKTLF